CAASGLLARLAFESCAIALGRSRTPPGCALGSRTDSEAWQLRGTAVLVAACAAGILAPPASGSADGRNAVLCVASGYRCATGVSRAAAAGPIACARRPVRAHPETPWPELHAAFIFSVGICGGESACH